MLLRLQFLLFTLLVEQLVLLLILEMECQTLFQSMKDMQFHTLFNELFFLESTLQSTLGSYSRIEVTTSQLQLSLKL